jgi:hypothetical protein
MTFLVLFGTGLCGIILSVGMCFAGEPGSLSARLLSRGIRIAKITVPILLLLLCLHATCDLDGLSKQVLGDLVENVRDFVCRHGSLFSSG